MTTTTGAGSGAPRQPVSRRRHDETTRVATLVAELERRRTDVLERFRDVTESLARTGLLSVVGEREVLAQLDEVHRRAVATVRQLAAASPQEVSLRLDELEQLLAEPVWQLAEAATQRLEGDRDEVAEERAALEKSLAEWPLTVDARRRALEEADRHGVVAPIRDRELKTMEALVAQAVAAGRVGNFGAVAERLARLDALTGGSGDDADFIAELQRARQEVGLIAQRAELLIIKSEEPAGSVVEYTVMLRMPRSEAQGVNLHSSSVVVRQDRATLRGIVESITAVVQRHVRAARTAAAPDGRSPGRAPAGTTGGPATGPVRSFVLDDDLAPLSGDLTERLRRVGRLLYTLFLPDSVQRLLDEVRTSVVITTNDLELPWELLHDGTEFLCLRRPMGRMPLGQNYPRLPRGGRETAEGSKLRVLLIGSDPKGDLVGVAREVAYIERTLKEQWGESVDVLTIVGDQVTGSVLNDHLQSGAFHIIHYAGHAAFDLGNAERSRLLLHDEEPCFAQKIQRILEGDPLVFINACESSSATNEATRQSTTYFAEETQGLASAFIYGGASVCVGSLWPVFDDTAAELAAHFYQRLLEGHMVGQALRLARLSVKDHPGDQVTWAAYALYGDPRYRLPFRPVAASTPGPT